MVMNKSLKLSTSTLGIVEIGSITALLAGDALQLSNFNFFINTLISVPVLIIAITLILVKEFGLICLVTPVVFVLLTWIQYKGSTWCLNNVFGQRAKLYDQLGTYINETIKGIKSIKFNGWEDLSLSKIMELRMAGQALTKIFFAIHTFMSYVANLFPPVTTLIIIWYTISTTNMTLADSYFLASITSLLFYPGKTVVTGLDTWNSVTIALRRIDKFLSVEEKKVNIESTEVALGTLKLRNLTASWINQSTATSYNYKGDFNSVSIKNIDFNFEQGKLYAIVGNVGSGKSSLLYSALGELEIKSGDIQINGSLAYVP
jgi:ATP-binding cassette subfamily C (CFTR/MRP) protein 4